MPDLRFICACSRGRDLIQSTIATYSDFSAESESNSHLRAQGDKRLPLNENLIHRHWLGPYAANTNVAATLEIRGEDISGMKTTNSLPPTFFVTSSRDETITATIIPSSAVALAHIEIIKTILEIESREVPVKSVVRSKSI